MSHPVIAVASFALLGLLLPTAQAGPGRRLGGAQGPHARRGAEPRPRGARRGERVRREGRALELTEAQRAAFRALRAETQPVREDLRAAEREIRREARLLGASPEVRQAARARRRAARALAARAVEPSAQRFVDALTPAQKQGLVARATARGRPLDDARLLRVVGRRLLAGQPGGEARRGAREDVGPPRRRAMARQGRAWGEGEPFAGRGRRGRGAEDLRPGRRGARARGGCVGPRAVPGWRFAGPRALPGWRLAGPQAFPR